MTAKWKVVREMTGGKEVAVTRVEVDGTGVAIEGRFTLPPLALLSEEDQAFVAAFVTCHGSIKQMEQLFGISYPTVKGRLNRITKALEAVGLATATPPDDPESILERVANGEMSVEAATEELKKCSR